MKCRSLLLFALLFALQATTANAAEGTVYPTAILRFEERGANVKDYGAQVSDLLFAELVASQNLYLVDRQEIDKIIAEQSLSASGAVKPGEATQLGQLTGAKLLITGSVMQVDKKIYLVAKIMGTETTRVAGASVNAKNTDELSALVTQLATKINDAIEAKSGELVPAEVTAVDRGGKLAKELSGAKLPKIFVKIEESHIGQPTIDPAAETEVSKLAQTAGFELVDPTQGTVGSADVTLTGEGFSEIAGRVGGLVSVKARVEIKAVDRKTGKIIVTDSQTAVVVDSSEQIAGKAALQEAAAQLAERILPKLAKE